MHPRLQSLTATLTSTSVLAQPETRPLDNYLTRWKKAVKKSKSNAK
jgi:hypothetical protein